MLLFGKVRIQKFRLRHIDLHGELGGLFVVAFAEVVGDYLVKMLAKLPEKKGATVRFFAREAEVRAGCAHVEPAVVAAGIPQALV